MVNIFSILSLKKLVELSWGWFFLSLDVLGSIETMWHLTLRFITAQQSPSSIILVNVFQAMGCVLC